MAVMIRWPQLFQIIDTANFTKVIARDTLTFLGVTLSQGSPDYGVLTLSGAPIDASYVVGVASTTLTAELVLGTQVIMRGTLAARPAASLDGRLYYVNDAGSERITRDTGAAWEDLIYSASFVSGATDDAIFYASFVGG